MYDNAGWLQDVKTLRATITGSDNLFTGKLLLIKFTTNKEFSSWQLYLNILPNATNNLVICIIASLSESADWKKIVITS